MPNLGQFIQTMVAETKMPGEEPALRRHLVSAMHYYSSRRFIKTSGQRGPEKSFQFTLVPQKDDYAPGGETIVKPGFKYLVFPDNQVGSVEFGNVLRRGISDMGLACRFRTDHVDLVNPEHLLSGRISVGAFNEYGLFLDDDTDEVRGVVNRDGFDAPLSWPVPGGFSDGEFHELGMSVETTDIQRLYLLWDDQIVAGPEDVTGADSLGDVGSFRFGNPFGANFRQFVGDLERVVMWDKGVNASDVRYMMDWEEGDEIPDSVIGFWPLLAGAGSFIEDQVPAPATPGNIVVDQGDNPPHHGQASPTVGWFDESQVDDYDFPRDIVQFDQVRRQIGTRSSVPLEPVSIGEMRELQASGLAFGQPDYYCWHHQRFIVWPRPSAAHVLTLDYHADVFTIDRATGDRITPGSPETAQSVMMGYEYEELLRTRALYTFALGRDDDYELAKRMKILNREAEQELMRSRDAMKVDGHTAAYHF